MTIDRNVDPERFGEIQRLLDETACREGVRLLWAVESGSRAWGFPSPDSDYDGRFIFQRPLPDYVALTPPRDVIELPLTEVLDINGWDLPKALRLMAKGNAVILEWLTSPIVYRGDPAFRDDMLALARDMARPDLVARHYLHLGLGQRRRYAGDRRAVPLKKIFYVLRPALALRWLRLHPGEAVAPMHFPTLLASAQTPRDVAEIAEDLIVRKAVTRELGTGTLSAAIERFLDDEFGHAERLVEDRTATPPADRHLLADAFFRRWLGVGA